MKIGVLGAGQLGRMLALAGYPLGLEFRFYDPVAESPAGQLAELIVGDYSDKDALLRFAKGLDILTYEFENVPVEAVRHLEQYVPVYPPVRALESSQDRLIEKRLFRSLKIPTPEFCAPASLDEALAAAFPSVLKTTRLGYDGKGQSVIRSRTDLAESWSRLSGAALILESYVPFEREVSLIAVRSKNKEVSFYPLVENVHRDGVLRKSLAPLVEAQLQLQAEEHARALLEALEYVGVLAIEFFVVGGSLIANEMAPRVHNSGHWTIEGAQTSQFENHIRAVAGLPLGSTKARGLSIMLNLLGVQPDMAEVLKLREVHFHWYGKSVRSGRKVGHITVTGGRLEDVMERVRKLEDMLQ